MCVLLFAVSNVLPRKTFHTARPTPLISGSYTSVKAAWPMHGMGLSTTKGIG